MEPVRTQQTLPHPNPPSNSLCLLETLPENRPEMTIPTNVQRLARAILPTDTSGTPQIVYYDPGLGSEGGLLDKIDGGVFGGGIDINIQQLYTFLALNYEDGDEIMLFGFSRGAYTVRSLVGMMYEAGLVTREKLDFVADAYKLYRENVDIDSDEAVKFREQHSRRVPIKLLLCFDTVGTLGIPFDLPAPLKMFFNMGRYRFHNANINPDVEHALHAVSIDEDRKSFQVTPMVPHATRGKDQVKEIYFPGFHGGVGGGNEPEDPLAKNCLKCVVDELVRRQIQLDLDPAQIPDRIVEDIPPQVQAKPMYKLIKVFTGTAARKIPSPDQVHFTAINRYNRFSSWRPAALESFKEKLLNATVSRE